jgi:hypothetical protein
MDPNDSNMKLLLDARCTENLPSGAFLVLKSLPGEVFLYHEGGVHSVLNGVSEILLGGGGVIQLNHFFITELDGE